MQFPATIYGMPRRPGKPTIDRNEAEPFWTAIGLLYNRVAKDGGFAELERMAHARHYHFTSTALRAQVLRLSRPSQEMQRCIASMLGISVEELIRKYSPNASHEIVSPLASPWKLAVDAAATVDGYAPEDIRAFFEAYPERGSLTVGAALAIIGAMRDAKKRGA